MKRLLTLTVLVALAACDTAAKRQIAQSDSARGDSIVRIKDEMLNEVMASTQFVNDLNTEIAKLKNPPKAGLRVGTEAPNGQAKADRQAALDRVRELVARLDSSEARVASLRVRAASLSKRDGQLAEQIAVYEKTITDLREAAERQRGEMQSIIDEQSTKIVALASKVDTVTQDNVRLAGERAALSDTVGQLTTEKNTVYYVVGTREELIKKGVVVEEGHKPVLGIFGSRPVVPARKLDPTVFTSLDRLRDRTIKLPEGQYSLVSRQDLAFATPSERKEDRVAGAIQIDAPEKFWEPSKFLVLVRR